MKSEHEEMKTEELLLASRQVGSKASHAFCELMSRMKDTSVQPIESMKVEKPEERCERLSRLRGGGIMTEKNERLRSILKEIESVVTGCLHGQPADDRKCEIHLTKALAKIADMSVLFLGKIEVEVYDIQWDTDGNDVDLPGSVRFMVDTSEDLDDVLADMLSDEFGWCVESFNWRIL